MISVIQRVRRAEVRVGEEVVAVIDRGLVALVAVVDDDGERDVELTADRLRHLRVFADPEGKMNLSVEEVGGALLLVSQFTLAGDTRRGRRPSFGAAAGAAAARELFDLLVATLEDGPVPIATGRFGASMEVELVNDGPVTLIFDSRHGRRGGRDDL